MLFEFSNAMFFLNRDITKTYKFYCYVTLNMCILTVQHKWVKSLLTELVAINIIRHPQFLPHWYMIILGNIDT